MKTNRKHYHLILFSVLLIFLTIQPSFCATLKIGMQEEPTTLNIFKVGDLWSETIAFRIYDRLYSEGPYDYSYVPVLAVGDPRYEPETQSFYIELVKNAFWHDGRKFTAEDVVFSSNLRLKVKFPDNFITSWEFIDRVEKVNDYAVRFFLKETKATFFSNTMLNDIVPKHIWEPILEEALNTANPSKTIREYNVTHPIGTGPFKFSQWSSGNFLKLEKFEKYHSTAKVVKELKLGPYVDELLFKIYQSTDIAILALKKGDIDFNWWSIPPGSVNELKEHKDITVEVSDPLGFKFIAFHVSYPEFNDSRFRQALTYLIDKDYLVKRVLRGNGIRADNIIAPANSRWHNPDTPKFGAGMNRAERVAKAVEILKSLGYTWKKEPKIKGARVTPGSGMMMPDGQPFKSFNILTPPADYDPLRAMAGQRIERWWKDIGLNVRATPISIPDILDRSDATGDYDVYILGWITPPIDPQFLSTLFHSRQAVKDGANTTGYKNPEVDRLADIADRTLDYEKRRDYVKQIQKIIVEDAFYVPLYSDDVINAYRNDRTYDWVEQPNGIANYWSTMVVKIKE